MSLLFGVACCYLGLGSGLFHASLTRWGQQLDVGSMYAPLLACIAINVGRYCPSHFRVNSGSRIPVWPLLASLVVLGSYLLYHYKWSMSSGQVLPIHILIVVVFALVDCIPDRSKIDPRTLNRRWLFVGMVALVLAVLFRQLDVARKFGTPESAIQGHALWHLLTALALGSMYLYYRLSTDRGSRSGPPRAAARHLPGHELSSERFGPDRPWRIRGVRSSLA